MEAESSRKSSAQVDRGWAWVVCIAGHFCIALTIGYATSLGVFFIEWKDQFELSATSSSWVVGMPLLVGSFGCEYATVDLTLYYSIYLSLFFIFTVVKFRIRIECFTPHFLQYTQAQANPFKSRVFLQKRNGFKSDKHGLFYTDIYTC